MAGFGVKMTGARLSYVVYPLEGTLKREVVTFEKKGKMTTMVKKEVDVPAGYLVYFPRGHVLRMDEEHLIHYGFADGEGNLRKPRIINMQGLQDPESPLGKMLAAQDDAARAGAYQELEQQVMQLAIARSGPVIMPEQVKRARFVEYDEHPGERKGKQKAAA